MGRVARIKEKADRLLDWAKGWDGFDGYLKLNAIVNEEGDSSLNIIVNDKEVQRYIDGTADRQFTAQFKMILPWSDGFDLVNSAAYKTMAELLDWVDDQFPENVPDWGCDITGITTVENAPALDFVNEQDSLAEYSFQVLIDYKE